MRAATAALCWFAAASCAVATTEHRAGASGSGSGSATAGAAAVAHARFALPAAAAAAAAAASTSDRLAWMRDYGSTEPWAVSARREQTVSIVLMTSHFFGEWPKDGAETAQCGPVRGATAGTPGAWNLTCVYAKDTSAADAADALW